MQHPGDAGNVSHDVQRRDGQPDLLRIARQEGLVDLQHQGPGGGQLGGLSVQVTGQRADQVTLIAVPVAPHPPRQ